MSSHNNPYTKSSELNECILQRVISLFECTNPYTNTRYELQLKGAGKTPYSRFADGKGTVISEDVWMAVFSLFYIITAVLRSSIREAVVSEGRCLELFSTP